MAKNKLKGKLVLKAIDLALTTDVANDYSLMVKIINCLGMDDISQYVVRHSNLPIDAAQLKFYLDISLHKCVDLLSQGYSITTPLGYFKPTAGGVMFESELMGAPPRDRLRLGVSYTMSKEMRQALEETEIDVEIQKSTSGPQIYAIVSTHDAQDPAAVTRGEAVPVQAGQTCIIKGRNLKVGGQAENIGVTITRTDDGSGQTYHYPPARLYPNTPTRVGFIMPADAPEGSAWSVSIRTGLGNNGQPIKTPRVTNMPHFFVVGMVGDDPIPGDDGGGNDPGWVDPTA